MLETILKTVFWTFVFIGAPIILIALIATVGAVAPIIGFLMLLFLPAIIVGIYIGRKSSDKDKRTE